MPYSTIYLHSNPTGGTTLTDEQNEMIKFARENNRLIEEGLRKAGLKEDELEEAVKRCCMSEEEILSNATNPKYLGIRNSLSGYYKRLNDKDKVFNTIAQDFGGQPKMTSMITRMSTLGIETDSDQPVFDKRNIEFVRSLYSKEGQKAFAERIMNSLLKLTPKELFCNTDEEVAEFCKNHPFELMCGFECNYFLSKPEEIKELGVDPKLYESLKEKEYLLQAIGNTFAKAAALASPYHGTLSERISMPDLFINELNQAINEEAPTRSLRTDSNSADYFFAQAKQVLITNSDPEISEKNRNLSEYFSKNKMLHTPIGSISYTATPQVDTIKGAIKQIEKGNFDITLNSNLWTDLSNSLSSVDNAAIRSSAEFKKMKTALTDLSQGKISADKIPATVNSILSVADTYLKNKESKLEHSDYELSRMKAISDMRNQLIEYNRGLQLEKSSTPEAMADAKFRQNIVDFLKENHHVNIKPSDILCAQSADKYATPSILDAYTDKQPIFIRDSKSGKLTPIMMNAGAEDKITLITGFNPTRELQKHVAANTASKTLTERYERYEEVQADLEYSLAQERLADFAKEAPLKHEMSRLYKAISDVDSSFISSSPEFSKIKEELKKVSGAKEFPSTEESFASIETIYKYANEYLRKKDRIADAGHERNSRETNRYNAVKEIFDSVNKVRNEYLNLSSALPPMSGNDIENTKLMSVYIACKYGKEDLNDKTTQAELGNDISYIIQTGGKLPRTMADEAREFIKNSDYTDLGSFIRMNTLDTIKIMKQYESFPTLKPFANYAEKDLPVPIWDKLSSDKAVYGQMMSNLSSSFEKSTEHSKMMRDDLADPKIMNVIKAGNAYYTLVSNRLNAMYKLQTLSKDKNCDVSSPEYRDALADYMLCDMAQQSKSRNQFEGWCAACETFAKGRSNHIGTSGTEQVIDILKDNFKSSDAFKKITTSLEGRDNSASKLFEQIRNGVPDTDTLSKSLTEQFKVAAKEKQRNNFMEIDKLVELTSSSGGRTL